MTTLQGLQIALVDAERLLRRTQRLRRKLVVKEEIRSLRCQLAVSNYQFLVADGADQFITDDRLLVAAATRDAHHETQRELRDVTDLCRRHRAIIKLYKSLVRDTAALKIG